MRIQLLSSGSAGNSLLVRAGDVHLLVDAGLPLRLMRERFEAARLPYNALDHILVTHGHLDHARSAGVLAKRHGALLHCPEKIMSNTSVKRAPRSVAIRIGSFRDLEGCTEEPLRYRPTLLPHDCDPTVAYTLEHGERRLIVLTDMGHYRQEIGDLLMGAHVLVLEFNYDEQMLENGPYPPALKRRVGGDRGHLSNEQAGRMLTLMAGPELHTVVLAHLSEKNNLPELALAAAHEALERAGRQDVRVVVAEQHAIGETILV